jgi:ankyrin repeat protein
MSATGDLVGWFELHDQERIRAALRAGTSATALINGKRPVDLLIEMYTRSPAFQGCLRVLLDAGASVGDPVLEALLLDDLPALTASLASDAQTLNRRFSLPCAYTSLLGVSALHVCAEYNSIRCARALLEAGLDVDVRADVDADGLGGHTPIFHAVNSNQNHCRPVLELLTAAGADLDIRLRGLVWGGGFEWETVVFDVSPISYAQCGLYAQFHRREQDVYSNLDHLYQRRFGVALPFRNVPNKYLRS